MTKQVPNKLKKVFVNLFGIGSAEWQDDPTRFRPSWDHSPDIPRNDQTKHDHYTIPLRL